IERLKQYYDSKGFYLSYIDFRLIERKNQKVELVYSIVENKKIFVQRIHFIGNEKYDGKELKHAIRTKEKSFLSFLNRSGKYYKEMLEFDRQMLSEFYGSHGYINAKIQAPKVEIFKDKQSLQVTFALEEGKPYYFDGFDITGDLIFDQDKLESKVKMKQGDLASIQEIRKDLRAISDEYTNRGYAYANIVPNFQFREGQDKVFVEYVVTPGQQIYIRDIVIQGNESNRDKVLLRELEINEGDLFNAKAIRQSKQKLDRLALFETVEITTPKTENPEQVDLLIVVKEKQTGSFNIGAGFNTLESFQVIGSLNKRSIFGYGVDVSLRAQIGKITQIFDLTYHDPYFLDSKWGMTLNAFNIGRRYTNFGLTSTGGSLGFDYPILVDGLKRIRAGLTYRLVNQDLANLRPTVETLFSDGVTSSVTLSLSHDTRNQVVFATDGAFYRISQEFAGTSLLGGSNSFSKTEFDARMFLPIAKSTNIPLIKKSFLAFRFNTGYVAPLEDGTRVPLFERYFPGGVFSIRGFRLRSLGPRIPVASANDIGSFTTSDFVIGGNKQVVFNAEYVVPLIDSAKIFGVVFFDMGNAFDNGESLFTFSGQRQSAGFELRWFSPIAPLRFAWGFPLDRQEGEGLVQFDFTFGSLF
ncbi:MAG: outer membrane protein assembly factor BamA, partial [Deltaproteobacteria bacterium]|nr:outer membrane protein assembly factor BamA [Deltaproteobacteria bacterium]